MKRCDWCLGLILTPDDEERHRNEALREIRERRQEAHGEIGPLDLYLSSLEEKPPDAVNAGR